MKPNLVEQIEKYLNGELTSEEFSEFEKRLENDSEFAREVLLYINVDKAISEINVIDLRMKIHDIYEKINSQKQVRHQLFPLKWQYLAAAATITLIVSMGVSIIGKNRINNDELLDKYYSAYEAEGIVRGASDNVSKFYQDALNAYNRHDYKTSAIKFKEQLDEDFTNIQCHFYYGISCFEINDIREAIKSFQLIIDHNNNLYVEQAQWYLGLCYLKLFDTQKAISIFNSIIQEDSTYREKAEEIVRKLN